MHREACVFERTLPEVWAARWRHQAQEEGWQTEGEKHIGASVCKQTPGGDWNHGKVVGYGGDGEDDRDGSVRTLNSHLPFISDGLLPSIPKRVDVNHRAKSSGRSTGTTTTLRT